MQICGKPDSRAILKCFQIQQTHNVFPMFVYGSFFIIKQNHFRRLLVVVFVFCNHNIMSPEIYFIVANNLPTWFYLGYFIAEWLLE